MLSWYSHADDIRKIKIISDKVYGFDAINFEVQIKDEYNIKINISEVVYVDYEYEAKESGKWKKESDSVVLYKVDGRWFVMGDLF